MEVQTYRVVDSVLDKTDVNHLEEHGFLIAGGFGILTNVSSNVYVSALLVIYVISLLEAVVYRENEPKYGQKRNVYFAWASVGLAIVFVMLQLFVKFNTYHQVQWGKSNIEVTSAAIAGLPREVGSRGSRDATGSERILEQSGECRDTSEAESLELRRTRATDPGETGICREHRMGRHGLENKCK
jgi:hypothetical protein